MKGHHAVFLLLLPPTPPWLWPGIFVWNLRNLHENSFSKPNLGFTTKHGLGCVLWQGFSQKFPAKIPNYNSPFPPHKFSSGFPCLIPSSPNTKDGAPPDLFSIWQSRRDPQGSHKLWEFSLLQGLTLPSTLITDIIFASGLYSFF